MIVRYCVNQAKIMLRGLSSKRTFRKYSLRLKNLRKDITL